MDLTQSPYILDDLTQLSFPSYTQCLYIYSTPSLLSSSSFSSLSSSLSASFQETINSCFSYLTCKLKRDHENGGKLTLFEPGSIHNPIDFFEEKEWVPTQKSLEIGDLSGWPVMSKLIGGSLLLEEEHISVKMKVTWCHAQEKREGEREGEGEGEGERERSVVVIGGLFSHLLFDGSTRSMFMNEWAAVHRQMFNCEIASLPRPSPSPIFNPSVLVGESSPLVSPPPPSVKMFIPHEEIKNLFTDDQAKRTTLRVLFPKSVLEKLQNECSNDEVTVSKNDCLFSLMWKILQKSAKEPIFTPEGDQLGHFAMSVRGRYPDFTSRHVGNAIVMCGTNLDDVRDMPLGEIAREVRKNVGKCSKIEYIQEVMDYSHQIKQRELGIFTATSIGKSFVSTQWRNLNMYNTNFGPSLGGTPALIIPPFDFNGFLITLPPRPSPSPSPQQKDEEEGIIAQFTLFGEGEREKAFELLPEGVKFLTDLNLDIKL